MSYSDFKQMCAYIELARLGCFVEPPLRITEFGHPTEIKGFDRERRLGSTPYPFVHPINPVDEALFRPQTVVNSTRHA